MMEKEMCMSSVMQRKEDFRPQIFFSVATWGEFEDLVGQISKSMVVQSDYKTHKMFWFLINKSFGIRPMYGKQIKEKKGASKCRIHPTKTLTVGSWHSERPWYMFYLDLCMACIIRTNKLVGCTPTRCNSALLKYTSVHKNNSAQTGRRMTRLTHFTRNTGIIKSTMACIRWMM